MSWIAPISFLRFCIVAISRSWIDCLTSPRQRARLKPCRLAASAKTAFHQMLPAFAIESSSLGVGLSTRSIQEVLIAMAFNAAARFGTGAELPQPATQTHPSLGDVFPTEAQRVQPPRLHHFAGRAQEGVTLWSVEERRFWIDPDAPPPAT